MSTLRNQLKRRLERSSGFVIGLQRSGDISEMIQAQVGKTLDETWRRNRRGRAGKRAFVTKHNEPIFFILSRSHGINISVARRCTTEAIQWFLPREQEVSEMHRIQASVVFTRAGSHLGGEMSQSSRISSLAIKICTFSCLFRCSWQIAPDDASSFSLLNRRRHHRQQDNSPSEKGKAKVTVHSFGAHLGCSRERESRFCDVLELEANDTVSSSKEPSTLSYES